MVLVVVAVLVAMLLLLTSTLAVSKSSVSPPLSKVAAWSNMWYMSVTPPVSHSDRFSLKLSSPPISELMSVT